MNQNLNPCPFCGSQAELIKILTNEYCIECGYCDASSGNYASPEIATKQWNNAAKKFLSAQIRQHFQHAFSSKERKEGAMMVADWLEQQTE